MAGWASRKPDQFDGCGKDGNLRWYTMAFVAASARV